LFRWEITPGGGREGFFVHREVFVPIESEREREREREREKKKKNKRD